MSLFSSIKNTISEKAEYPIWTKSFTILTVGSIISVMASSTLYFCLSLLVLDLSESVLMYSLYLSLTQIARIVVPLIIGPFVDNHSRRKMIYSLDFLSGAIFFVIWFLFKGNEFKTWMILVSTIIITTIDAIYTIAYQSLFPMLVHPDNLQKAYSITSMLDTLSGIMIPFATAMYEYIGIQYVLLVGACLYWLAAITEVFIVVDEATNAANKQNGLKKYLIDFKEGIKFVSKEKALLLLAIFFLFSNFAYGIREVVWLPYFRALPKHGYLWYIIITGAGMGGTFVAGVLMYMFKVPSNKQFLVFIIMNLISCITIGSALYLPNVIAMIAVYFFGISTQIIYNYRSIAVQSYLSNNLRGRYLGVAVMFSNIGALVGQLFAGSASEIIPLKTLNLINAGSLTFGFVLCFLILGRKACKELINLEHMEKRDSMSKDTVLGNGGLS